METLVLLLIGLCSGTVGGFFGIGGGIVMLPALVLLLGYGQKLAQGTSLVALIAPVGILSLINYYKEGYVNLFAGAWIALGFFFGGFIGSKIALNLDENLLRKAFAVFLLIISIRLFVQS